MSDGRTKARHYRQSDELYDRIGRLADALGTFRTTIVELAIESFEEGLSGRAVEMQERAREIDRVRRETSCTAAMDALERYGMARRKG